MKGKPWTVNIWIKEKLIGSLLHMHLQSRLEKKRKKARLNKISACHRHSSLKRFFLLLVYFLRVGEKIKGKSLSNERISLRIREKISVLKSFVCFYSHGNFPDHTKGIWLFNYHYVTMENFTLITDQLFKTFWKISVASMISM